MTPKPVIVGTAGHIDHGKTALVKALTGIDADRLEEEKRRGITIDIGFAHLEVYDQNGELFRLGFVDVPGHERFVRNMLAGIGGIDLVLLVIAADEGIMPQTREHFEICRLLGVSQGITVLTKADKVSPERLQQTKQTVQDLVRGSFLDASRSAIVAVSAATGEGLDELKQKLLHSASEMSLRELEGTVRLPVDRVFTMRGFGTVVTGTLVSGHIRCGEELEILPSQLRVRVRGVQVHNAAVDSASAGERTALNLTGVQKEEVSRGMTLVRPALFRTTKVCDAELDMIVDTKNVKPGTRFHLHGFTSEVVATVVRFDPSSRFARLNLAEPMLLFPGDRFILRRFSPVVTVGGGKVLDAFPMKSSSADRIKFLQAVRGGDAGGQLLARIDRRRNDGFAIAGVIAETGWSIKKIEELISELITQKKIERFNDVLVGVQHFDGLRRAFVDKLRSFHDSDPLAAGIAREHLRAMLAVPEQIFAAATARLLQEKKIAEAGEYIKLADRSVSLRDDEEQARRMIESAFSKAGLKAPALADVLAGVSLDKARAHKIVTLLLREGVLVKIGDDLVFHATALSGLRKTMQDYKSTSSTIDVSDFKQITQVSRKYAIPLLEFLDRERVTRRQGDVRVIL